MPIRRSLLAAGAALALGAALLGVALTRPPAATGPAPETLDLAAGAALYAENCASCHGAKLEGQADWRSRGADGLLPAPPHDETGHTWHHDDATLFAYTELGGTGALAEAGIEGVESGMPAFGDILSDAEIWNVIGYIRSTWPDDIQEIQAERTRAATP